MMVRERLRGMQERTWLHHAAASGPELVLALVALAMMPVYLWVSLPFSSPHPLDSVPFPVMTVVALLGLVGSVAWLCGWYLEKAKGLASALKWDRFGAAWQALCWALGSLIVMAHPGLPFTNGAVTLGLSAAWLLRYVATTLLARRAQEAELLVRRADEALRDTPTGSQEQVSRRWWGGEAHG